jgi:hypothetical protein
MPRMLYLDKKMLHLFLKLKFNYLNMCIFAELRRLDFLYIIMLSLCGACHNPFAMRQITYRDVLEKDFPDRALFFYK